ncbi:hypothetical protein BS78_K123500 [Paspalum vaginatum]|uniref:Late embryogenesis abundant protein LEA-2 subgroup domain-containing protein n=1 Tax=Paspalum vaginatum TaxID=158149 RepID=A0A9W8CDT4_9POAL|nr:hypothetical protein BS78_K123500 [Paspalum vaginatum]
MIRSPGAMLHLRCVLISCGIASTLIAVALLAVTLTVYRVREPVMTMNAISLEDPGAAASSSPPPLTLTVVADVSVKNPNAASLRYGATETSVYYRARQVGEALGPPGTAPARRTVRLNVTVDVALGALLGDPAFLEDVAAGAVAVATATRVRGRVAVLGALVRRRVVLEMNCTATVAVTDMSISDQSCQQRVWLR